MSTNPSNFEQAEYVNAPLIPVAPIEPDTNLLARAIVFGLGGAVLGAIIYAAFITITHIQIGYLAIGVAYLVAKAMMMGSRERGGRMYQVSALILTCCAVALGNAMMLWWSVQKTGPIPFSIHNLFVFVRFGFSEPFLEFQDSPGSAILGVFILFIGLRAAWRMTSGLPGSVRHPFSR
jgi:hypothetical protein